MKKNNDKEIIKQQSNLKFRASLKIYTNYDSCIFKQSEVLMDKLKYRGFAVLELIKLLINLTKYGGVQPKFGENLYKYTIWLLIVSY